MATDLVDTTEMYLRTILELEEEGVPALRARIAERLEQSGPTVSQTVARMERHGLLHVKSNRQLILTDLGRKQAVSVMRKHRLAERLLVDIIGLPYEQAHDEACKWEHVMSDDVERRVYELLHKPDHSPYGNAIPGLVEFDRGADDTDPEGVSLTSVDDGQQVRVVRLVESVQTQPELLTSLHEAGLDPDAVADVNVRNGDFVLAGPKGEALVTRADAERFFVSVV
ncbi:metal-dependent transcriptional regulator [Haloglycomyces albus]|uniref:metal-dependent transcriptional regulator n=1 Tax=Haloglycomyces albus TaxID=526067 RepID=UPI00046CE37C|nr:metal-dependent transcriptional regulator [Haloglycomyces albus]